MFEWLNCWGYYTDIGINLYSNYMDNFYTCSHLHIFVKK